MASFLKKMVSKTTAKSRSKSPVKYSNPAERSSEFEHWTHRPLPIPPHEAPPPGYYTMLAHQMPPDGTLPRESPSSYMIPHQSASGHHHHMQPYPSQSLQIPPSPNLQRHPSSRLCNGYGGSAEYGIGCTNTWNTETTSAGSYRDRAASSHSRPRSASPRKSPRDSFSNGVPHKSRSKSPAKRMQQRTIVHNYDYLQPQCRIEGCTASIVVHDSRFLVCKHQLSHASEYFRSLFLNNSALPLEGVRQNALNEFAIVVSGLSHPSPSTQFKWFVESVIPTPVLKDISDDTLETCMRLSKRFRAHGLELRCSKYIQEFVSYKPPMVALCWLNWCLKHRFERPVTDACLPSVARLPLVSLEKHRAMISERILADVLAAKLRTCYEQSVSVFQTIHQMDHFTVDVERCPRCGRQREQGKVRIQANPCRKLLGCERCLKDLGCEIEKKSQGDYVAFYQCPHGLMAMSERSEDCHCQLPLLRRHLSAIRIVAGHEDAELPPRTQRYPPRDSDFQRGTPGGGASREPTFSRYTPFSTEESIPKPVYGFQDSSRPSISSPNFPSGSGNSGNPSNYGRPPNFGGFGGDRQEGGFGGSEDRKESEPSGPGEGREGRQPQRFGNGPEGFGGRFRGPDGPSGDRESSGRGGGPRGFGDQREGPRGFGDQRDEGFGRPEDFGGSSRNPQNPGASIVGVNMQMIAGFIPKEGQRGQERGSEVGPREDSRDGGRGGFSDEHKPYFLPSFAGGPSGQGSQDPFQAPEGFGRQGPRSSNPSGGPSDSRDRGRERPREDYSQEGPYRGGPEERFPPEGPRGRFRPPEREGGGFHPRAEEHDRRGPREHEDDRRGPRDRDYPPRERPYEGRERPREDYPEDRKAPRYTPENGPFRGPEEIQYRPPPHPERPDESERREDRRHESESDRERPEPSEDHEERYRPELREKEHDGEEYRPPRDKKERHRKEEEEEEEEKDEKKKPVKKENPKEKEEKTDEAPKEHKEKEATSTSSASSKYSPLQGPYPEEEEGKKTTPEPTETPDEEKEEESKEEPEEAEEKQPERPQTPPPFPKFPGFPQGFPNFNGFFQGIPGFAQPQGFPFPPGAQGPQQPQEENEEKKVKKEEQEEKEEPRKPREEPPTTITTATTATTASATVTLPETGKASNSTLPPTPTVEVTPPTTTLYRLQKNVPY